MKRGAIAAVIAVGIAVPLLTGCGEKDEPATTGPVVAQTTTGPATAPNGGGTTTTLPSNDREIEAVVRTYLTVPNQPRVCEELITPRFLKRSYGNMAGCVASRKPSAMARSVSITSAEPRATVQAKPVGGVYGGQKLDVTVVLIDGQPKIDEISGNAKVGP